MSGQDYLHKISSCLQMAPVVYKWKNIHSMKWISHFGKHIMEWIYKFKKFTNNGIYR